VFVAAAAAFFFFHSSILSNRWRCTSVIGAVFGILDGIKVERTSLGDAV
jgi:hypothetical protein